MGSLYRLYILDLVLSLVVLNHGVVGVRSYPVSGRQAHGKEVLVRLESQPGHVPQPLMEFMECPAKIFQVESPDRRVDCGALGRLSLIISINRPSSPSKWGPPSSRTGPET